MEFELDNVFPIPTNLACKKRKIRTHAQKVLDLKIDFIVEIAF